MTRPDEACDSGGWEWEGRGRQALVSVLSRLGRLVLRAWRGSWRADMGQAIVLESHLRQGRPQIVVFWQGDCLPLCALLEDYGALGITGPSFRGALFAGVVRLSGHRALQIGAGEERTIQPLLRELARPCGLVALAADGPPGPRHGVRPGVVVLAVRSGAQVLPVRITASRQIELTVCGDRMALPLPGASVRLQVGEPLTFCRADLLDIRAATRRLAARMQAPVEAARPCQTSRSVRAARALTHPLPTRPGPGSNP